jgi:lipopolysaccharide export system protein LptC
MSELAERERLVKRGWAAPGSAHDSLIGVLKIALPAAIGVLIAYLALAPLVKGPEISFLLDKNKVDVAGERMRVEAAQYRGQDSAGRPFLIRANEAVQATSRDPVVDIMGMAAQISLTEGPAALVADKGRYDMEGETVDVTGPVRFRAADGYRIETRDVLINLDQRTLASDGPVEGQMPLGSFSANRLEADLPQRKVVLSGRARLRIVQRSLR